MSDQFIASKGLWLGIGLLCLLCVAGCNGDADKTASPPQSASQRIQQLQNDPNVSEVAKSAAAASIRAQQQQAPPSGK